VAPGGLIERRDADQAMHAGLRRQQPVGVLSRHRERRALQSSLVARLIVDHLALESAALHPPHVHPQEHLGPVLRFGAACAGMNGDDRVLAIVFTAEHLLDFAGLDLLIEKVESLRELAVHGLACGGPLDEHREVVASLAQRHHEIAIQFETPAALQHALRFSLIFPEVRRGGARLEAGQFFIDVRGFKDSSAGPQPVC
jgi:hypothetical protein